MRLSFKTKALFIFCPVIILISLAYMVTAIRVEQKLLRSEIIKRGEVLIAIATKNAELPLLSGNAELVKNAALPISEVKNVPFVTFYDPLFAPIVHQGQPAVMLPPEDVSPDDPFSIREQVDYFEFYAPVFSMRPEGDLDMFAESGPEALSRDHIGWVRVGLSKEVMHKTLWNMARNGVLFSLLLVAIGVSLVTLLLNLMLRPLNALFNAAKNLREGEYPHVPFMERNDEIGQLSSEFNKMSSAIRDREERLLYSQKKISDLFERVEHAIFRMDPVFKVIEGNGRFTALCGGSPDFFDLVQGYGRQDLKGEILAGQLVGKEVTIIAPDGKQHIISLSMYPETGDDSVVTGYDGHFVDITEKKTMEDTLFKNQKLESLGLLAGGIAHDFNNILTVIIGYSDLVSRLMKDDDPLQEKIKEIHEHGIKAAALTRQLLAFSRKQVMELRVLNLNGLISNMTKMLGRLIGETIEMKLLLKTSAGNIKADPGQIEQIIMNLAINAKDAMSEGGRLVFETDTVVLDEEYCRSHADLAPGSYVLLAVTDTGCGMTPEVREKIFDPFFTTKTKGAGTGLGLSTVYGIVKQLKGHIFVYSEPGRGTTFKVYFPEIQEPEEKVSVKSLSEEGLQGRETILVVDDEASIRNLICDTLRPLGYRVLEASSDERTLEIGNNPDIAVDLLLTDVIMPGMGGRKLADSLQSLKPGMKVLFMSGYTDEIIAHQGVLEPGTLFINKPLIPSILIKKIRRIFDG